MSLLRKSDRRWIEDVLLRTYGIPSIRIREATDHKAKYPDIWIEGSGEGAIVTITPEWARQPRAERLKRIVHEIVGHLVMGLGHGKKERAMGYYSHPEKDEYSRKLYRDIIKGTRNE